jgi:hypothetical protein
MGRTLIHDMGLEGYEGVSEDHARVLMAVRGYHAIGQAPDIGNIGNACGHWR